MYFSSPSLSHLFPLPPLDMYVFKLCDKPSYKYQPNRLHNIPVNSQCLKCVCVCKAWQGMTWSVSVRRPPLLRSIQLLAQQPSNFKPSSQPLVKLPSHYPLLCLLLSHFLYFHVRLCAYMHELCLNLSLSFSLSIRTMVRRLSFVPLSHSLSILSPLIRNLNSAKHTLYNGVVPIRKIFLHVLDVIFTILSIFC